MFEKTSGGLCPETDAEVLSCDQPRITCGIVCHCGSLVEHDGGSEFATMVRCHHSKLRHHVRVCHRGEMCHYCKNLGQQQDVCLKEIVTGQVWRGMIGMSLTGCFHVAF